LASRIGSIRIYKELTKLGSKIRMGKITTVSFILLMSIARKDFISKQSQNKKVSTSVSFWGETSN
jgi:hypothetical protein